MKKISFEIPDNVHTNIKLKSAMMGLTIQKYILQCISVREELEKTLESKDFDQKLDEFCKKHYKLAQDLSQL